MIKLKSITKYFDDFKALDNVNLDIHPSKTTILIGPSGCGKSTLIRILTGLVLAEQGHFYFQDKSINKTNINDFRKKIGYVIQEGGLFPHLTGFENVTIMAKYLKVGEEKINERIEFLCGITKLNRDLLKNYPVQLSGGQRQRLSLMRALMLDPDILFLDEPLGALDPLIRYDLQTDLKEIFNKLNKTVVMVTHDLAEAIYFGDKIVLMQAGNIVQEGTPENLINNPKDEFVTKFINAQRNHLN